MSVAGYIGRNVKERWIPREGTDDLGIRYGDAEAQRADGGGESVAGCGSLPGPSLPNRETYESVEDYDPVLRSHCRL